MPAVAISPVPTLSTLFTQAVWIFLPYGRKPAVLTTVPQKCPLKFLSIHPPSLACHHRPCPGPRPRSTLEAHPEPIRRTSLQAQAAGYRGDAASGWWGSGGALPETPEQKYRLIYLSAGTGRGIQRRC